MPWGRHCRRCGRGKQKIATKDPRVGRGAHDPGSRATPSAPASRSPRGTRPRRKGGRTFRRRCVGGACRRDAASLALIIEDPDAPMIKPFVHWLIWNLPPTTTGLPVAVPTTADAPRVRPARCRRRTTQRSRLLRPPAAPGPRRPPLPLPALRPGHDARPGAGRDPRGLGERDEGARRLARRDRRDVRAGVERGGRCVVREHPCVERSSSLPFSEGMRALTAVSAGGVDAYGANRVEGCDFPAAA